MIHKAASLTVRDGRVLLCRKHGTLTWILPGGKIEPGETHEQALRRELDEELSGVTLGDIAFLRRYDYHNPEGVPLRLEVFAVTLIGDPLPSAEIAELVWHPPGEPLDHLSPSLRDLILPDVAAGRLSA